MFPSRQRSSELAINCFSLFSVYMCQKLTGWLHRTKIKETHNTIPNNID